MHFHIIHFDFIAYYGVTMSATSISSDVYIAFIMSGLVETPGLLNIWFMNHWGRKPTLMAALSISAMGCMVAGFTSRKLKLIFVLIGKWHCINTKTSLGLFNKVYCFKVNS